MGRDRWIRVIGVCVYIYMWLVIIHGGMMLNYVYMLCWCCYCIVIVEFMILFSELGWWSWWWAELREGHIVCGVWLCLEWHMECRQWLELAKMWNDFNGAKLDYFQLISNAELPYQTMSEHRQIWHTNTLRVPYNFRVLVKF